MTPEETSINAPGRPEAQRISRRHTVPLGAVVHGTLVVALLGLALSLAATAAPVATGLHSVVVRGGSMGDSIPSGSLVMARWVPKDRLHPGDVILIQEEQDGGAAVPKIHRIVSLEHDGVNIIARTKGDGNRTPDANVYVLPDRVLTPAYHIEYLGLLVAFVMTARGWLLVVALPGASLCAFTLRSIWFSASRAARPPALLR